MAITVNETQITWAAANFVTVAAGGAQTSDAFTIDQTCFQAMIQCKADNLGTPAAGDYVNFYLLATLGDPDGAVANEYGTRTQDQHLCILDTNTDDPAIASVQVPLPMVGGKIYAVSDAGSNNIRVSATILEQRG